MAKKKPTARKKTKKTEGLAAPRAGHDTRKKMGDRSPARKASDEMPEVTGKHGASPLRTLLAAIVERRGWLRAANGPRERQEVLLALSSVLEVAGYLSDEFRDPGNRSAIQTCSTLIADPATLTRADIFARFAEALDRLHPEREK